MDVHRPNDGNRRLHIFFFPFPAPGHMIPMIDLAKLFASRGVKTSIITTPPYADKISTPSIQLLLLTGGRDTTWLEDSDELRIKLFTSSASLFSDSLKTLMEQHRPDCLVSDTFFPWTTDLAAELAIPKVVFDGRCFFSLCAEQSIMKHQPHREVHSDDDVFALPNFPGEPIYLTKEKISVAWRSEIKFTGFYKKCLESERNSYGVLVNSFYELEPLYADHYRATVAKRAWHVGPVSLLADGERDEQEMKNRGTIMTTTRKEDSSIDCQEECLKWLDSKEPNSIIYLCFGSEAEFTAAQNSEIAAAMEASELGFVWLVKRKNNKLPEGFEERMRGKGLVIEGWVPQRLILSHAAVGGFVTHCGWNSVVEAIAAGVPMVTWPMAAEQFYNEKLVSEVLGIGVEVGARRWVRLVGDFVGREAVETAARGVMVGEKAEEMRRRVRKLGMQARNAVEEGGSSFRDVDSFIEEFMDRKKGL